MNYKKQIENMFLLSCDRNFPKNRAKYEFLIGSIVGSIVSFVPFEVTEKVIRIICDRYPYQNTLFSDREDMVNMLVKLFSDIYTCCVLLSNKENSLPLKEKIENSFAESPENTRNKEMFETLWQASNLH